jgi:hypothetical protein
MECFDVPMALHALIGCSLIVAGANLMMQIGTVLRAFGAYCFAFGYFLLGLAASGYNIGDFNLTSRRYLLGVGSALAIVAGTLLMYYHIQVLIRQAIQGQLSSDEIGVISKDVITAIPVFDHVLIYAGFAGLVLTVALRDDNSFNMTKAGLALVALLVIGFTKNKMLQAVINGQDVQKTMIAHILSWGLLILAIAYSC